jgi:hypothetical protein
VASSSAIRFPSRLLPSCKRFFLHSGPPPIYVGFGSIVVSGIKDLMAVVLDAVHATGTRAIISRGWSHLEGEKYGVLAAVNSIHSRLQPAKLSCDLFPDLPAALMYGNGEKPIKVCKPVASILLKNAEINRAELSLSVKSPTRLTPDCPLFYPLLSTQGQGQLA